MKSEVGLRGFDLWHFAFTASSSPRGANAEVVRKKAGYLRGMVDAVNITDNQTGVVRMQAGGCLSPFRKV